MGKVRHQGNDQKLSVKASNDVFGDTRPGHFKPLVVVSSYSSGTVQQKVAAEGGTVDISPSQNATTHKKDRLSLSFNSIVTTSKQQQPLTVNILGAAYGPAIVTIKAQSLVTSNHEFDQMASNETWGDVWSGHDKTLVVVYECSEYYLVDIAVWGDRMHFIASPPFSIFGLAYGLRSVTEKVKQIVHHRSSGTTANDKTFGDGWPEVAKTLVIVYHYGEEQPSVAIAKKNNKHAFLYLKKEKFYAQQTPTSSQYWEKHTGQVITQKKFDWLLMMAVHLTFKQAISVW